ncbi:hypothetical protein C0J52_19816, partial [Blattella germanica]
MQFQFNKRLFEQISDRITQAEAKIKLGASLHESISGSIAQNSLMCHFKGKYMKFCLVQNYTTMSAMGVYFKMADFTGAERAKCVLWYENSQSATTVQRNFRTHYHKRPPTR